MTIAKVLSPPQRISARYDLPMLGEMHTITRQLCQLRLDHAKFHHEGAEILAQSCRSHGTFDAAGSAGLNLRRHTL